MSSPAGSTDSGENVIDTSSDIADILGPTSTEALESEYLRLALDTHAIVSVADPRGNIIYVNDKFCEVSGYSRVDLLGANHRIVKSGMHPAEFYLTMWRTISSGRIWQGEVCNRARNGDLYWVASTIVPFLDASGLPYQYVSIRTDVTAQRRSEQLLAALAVAEARTIAEEAPEEIFPQLLHTVLPLLGCEFGFIGECSESALPGLDLLAISDDAWDTACRAMHARLHDGHLHLENLDTAVGRSLMAGRAVTVDRATLAAQALGDDAPPLDNFLALPLMRGEVTLGMIGLGNRPGGFDDALLQFLQPLAATCGSMLAGLRARRQRDRITEALILARDQAEQASRAKSEFLSRMSHELRTPLNAIIGFGQLLATDAIEPPTPDQKESIDQILSAGRHLLELINEVLDLSRLEADRLNPAKADVVLPALLDECLLLLQAFARERHITVHPPAAADDIRVGADPARLKQVLLNVLSNAIKHNEPGGEVHVQIADGAAQIGVIITDTGQGVAPAEQERIFHPATRLAPDGEGAAGAEAGVGLTITRHLLEQMGGRIELISAPGHGSTFTLWLPRATKTTAKPTAVTADHAGKPRRRLLYIEDDAANRQQLTNALAGVANWEIVTARTGQEGLMLARHLAPELILLDLDLPDADGLDIKRQIDAMPHCRNVPMVAVCTDRGPEDVRREHAAGFADYLTTPFDPTLLPAALTPLMPA